MSENQVNQEICSSGDECCKAHVKTQEFQARQQRTVTRPRLDIRETDQAFFLYADMPGVDDRSTEVVVEKRILTISGTASLFEGEGYEQVYKESGPRYYERLIRLPEDVDAAQLEAHVKNGVLKIKLPKTQAAQTVRVQVQPG